MGLQRPVKKHMDRVQYWSGNDLYADENVRSLLKITFTVSNVKYKKTLQHPATPYNTL